MIVVIGGPTGAGKSTVGRALAGQLGWVFVDADDLHSPSSIEKMRAGTSLSDEERWPWLQRVKRRMLATARAGRPAVIACSVLRQDYRRYLADGLEPPPRFVFLRATRDLLERRVMERRGHFAPAALVQAQLETLEVPGDGSLVLDAAQSVEALVSAIRQTLALQDPFPQR